MVLWIWIDTIYNCFKETRISIKQKKIIYVIRSLFTQSQITLSIKEITKVEKAWNSITFSTNNSCYSLQPLTSIEVEWLTHEISGWLDLPIQKSDELTKNNLPKVSQSNKDNLPEVSQNESISYSSLSTSKVPSKPQCHINKIDNILEVSAPAPTYYEYFIGAICLLVFVVFGIASAGFTGAYVITIIINIIIGIITTALANSNTTQYRKDNKIILRIDQNTACLYRNSQPEKSLSQIYIRTIQKIEVVYHSPPSYNCADYHIVLKTSLGDQLLVGNRTHWLSKHEAYWIACELSNCLKVPVTER